MFNTAPSPNITKGSELGSFCTQAKLFITKGMVFNDIFAINSVLLFFLKPWHLWHYLCW